MLQACVLSAGEELTLDTLASSATLAYSGQRQVGGEQEAQAGHTEDGDSDRGQVKRVAVSAPGSAVGI